MSTVYRQRFVAFHAEVAGEIDYVVPAGFRAVLRDVWFAAKPSGGESTTAIFNAVGGYLWVQDWPSATAAFFFWQGRQVFEEGEAIRLYVNGIATPIDGQASGYLLSLP